MAKKPAIRSTDRLLQSLFVLSRAVEEVLEFHVAGRVTLSDGVTSNKLRVLCLLDQQGDQPATRVARFLGVSPGAITQLADSLKEAELIKRLRTGTDRRVVFLSLTPSGQRFVQSVRKEQRYVIQNTHCELTSAQVDKWATTLDQITSALTDSNGRCEDLCLQCGAYANGSCVLDGGTAACKFQAEKPVRVREKKTRTILTATIKVNKSRASSACGCGR